jgi:C4-dicarboxylate-specific signal transduction histidine kinase
MKVGQYLKLTVKDTGQRMRKEIMGKIFEPSFTTKEIEDAEAWHLLLFMGYSRSMVARLRSRSKRTTGSTR